MTFTILPNDLVDVATAAHSALKIRYGLNDAKIEQSIQANIPIRPTFHWVQKTGYLFCEVAQRPFPIIIKEKFAEISALGLPIRIIVAYPRSAPITAKEYQKDITEARKFGIGLIAIDDEGNGTVEYEGVNVSLHFPQIDYKRFKSTVRPPIRNAYANYMDQGNPKAGLQELGQIVEDIIIDIAIDAKKKSKLNMPNWNTKDYIACNVLINTMIQQNVMDVGLLGTCKTFISARNGVSHKPKSKKEAIVRDRMIKENFQIGMRILELLPIECRRKGLRFRVKK